MLQHSTEQPCFPQAVASKLSSVSLLTSSRFPDTLELGSLWSDYLITAEDADMMELLEQAEVL
jgi:hypothetical protein